MSRFLTILSVGLLASSLSLANERSTTEARSLSSDTTEESGEDYMERMYDEGLFVDPAPIAPTDPGIQAAVKICVDGSGWCLETTSYVDCNDWIASYEGEGTPSGISCYDVY